MSGNVGALLSRGPRTNDELWEFIYTFWNIKLSRVAVCPDHQAPFDAFADAFFGRYPVTVWKASRGFGGKSTMLGTLALTEATMGAEVTVLGGSAAQSLRIKEVVQNELFAHPLAPPNIITHMTKWDTELATGGHIRALTASQRSVRGPHPQRLRLDEIDEMEMEILEAAQGQPMMKHGIPTQTVMSSTHQYPDKTMTKILDRAKEKGWPIYTWCLAGLLTGVITDRGEVDITEVTTDDHVLTRQGWKRVQHVTYMGYKETVDVELTDGRTITCTPDHEIATPSGFVPASLIGSSQTNATMPPSVIGIDVEVVTFVGMPSRAMSFEIPSIVPRMLTMGDISEMLRIHTQSHSAQMVDVITDFTLPKSVGQPMSQLLTRTLVDNPIPARAGLPIPNPTSIGVNDDSAVDVLTVIGDGGECPVSSVGTRLTETLAPLGNVRSTFDTTHVASITRGAMHHVYDIGVEDAHEFIANGIVVHNCYRENLVSNDGWLPDSEVARKKIEISKVMWDIEYELQEPSMEGRAIDGVAVDTMFDPNLGVFDGRPQEFIEINPTDHNIAVVGWDFSDARYVTGVDWAKKNDWTVIWTFAIPYNPTMPWVLVAYERMNKLPWPVMAMKFDRRLASYPGAGVHDATGIGDVVGDIITNDVAGVVLSGQVRDGLWAEFVSGVEGGMFKAPRIKFAYDEFRFVTVDDLWGTGHTPDSFVAGALGWSVRKAVTRPKALSIVSITKGNSFSV